jgi:hypothetical protein
MPRERQVRLACRKVLKAWGAKVIPYPGGGYGEAGTPDLIACKNGRLILVECKQPKMHLSPIQEVRFTEWRAVGAVCIEAHSGSELQDTLDRGA